MAKGQKADTVHEGPPSSQISSLQGELDGGVQEGGAGAVVHQWARRRNGSRGELGIRTPRLYRWAQAQRGPSYPAALPRRPARSLEQLEEENRPDPKKKGQKPPCTWWQKTKATARALDRSLSIEAGSGVGLGAEVKGGGFVLGATAELMAKFTFDFYDGRFTFGTEQEMSFRSGIAYQTRSIGERYQNMVEGYFGTTDFRRLPDFQDLATRNIEVNNVSLNNQEWGFSATALVIKAGATFHASRVGEHYMSILTDEYNCDPN